MYSEFEGIESMTAEEKALYLLVLVRRYTDVIKEAKIILDETCLPAIEQSGCNDSRIRIKTRTVKNIDNNMLSTAFPEIYERLYEEGKLVAKAQDLKEYEDVLMDTVITPKTSKWLEFDDKI